MNNFLAYEYALALAEFGSFKRAALELNISQPALSKSITNLEAEFGTSLFDRRSRPLQPTECGKLLLMEARRCREGSRSLQENMLRVLGDSRGTLRIAFGPYASAAFARDFILRFSEQVPGHDLIVENRAWDALPILLRRGQVDLFAGDISSPTFQNEFTTFPLQQSKLMYFCTPNHPLAELRRLELLEAFQYPLVHCGTPPWARDYLKQHMPDYDFRESPAGVRLENYHLIREIILQGSHGTFGFKCFFGTELDAGHLVGIDLAGAPSTQAGVAIRKDETSNPAVQDAIDILTQIRFDEAP